MSEMPTGGVLQPGSSCSQAARVIPEPMPGTAPRAQSWLVIEQHGAYGRKALLDSALPRTVGEHLSATKQDSGTSVILARPTGAHARADEASRRVWLAHTAIGATEMHQARITDTDVLTELDVRAFAAGTMPNLGFPSSTPTLFVCTNGRRDACCALLGRKALEGIDDVDVWECSHLGGHRFAATAVLLPWGYVYGHVTAEAVRQIMAEARAGRVYIPGLRGRSALSRTAQAAEILVRRAFDIVGPDDLSVLERDSFGHVFAIPSSASAGPSRMQVRHQDGRAWDVTAVHAHLRPATPESCGGEPVARTTVRITTLDEAPAWR